MTYFRYCEEIGCGERFIPKSKYQKKCEKCLKKVKDLNFIKMIYSKRGLKFNDINQINIVRR